VCCASTLTSQFLCCRAVAPQWSRRDTAHRNIASIAARKAIPTRWRILRPSRGHLAHQVARQELAQSGVLVNCVTPAAAKTAIFDR